MKRLILAIAGCLGVLALSIGVAAALYWSQRTIWPVFPEPKDPKDLTPQAVVQVEPDFAWRTGDRIPVTIFIKQKPGVVVDQNSLAIQGDGDFEIAGNPEIYIRDTRDGTRYFRIKVSLQSFSVKNKLSLAANMSFENVADRETKKISLPGLDVYTSLTWDGRPERKDGPLAAIQGWHYWTTGLALLLGLAGAITSLFLMRRWRKAELEAATAPLTGRALARREFEIAWARIAAGDDSEANYKEIERIMRRLYRYETRTTPEIEFELGHNHPHLKQVLTIHSLCSNVLYRGMVLSDPEKIQIRETFDAITLPRQMAQAKPAAK